MPGSALARVRELCLSLPDTGGRPSHGAPTFFISGKHSFVTYHDNHRGDVVSPSGAPRPKARSGEPVPYDPPKP